MKKVEVVRMSKEDVEAVYNIEALVHPEHHWSKESFFNEIANNLAYYYCVKNEQGEHLGFIGLWHILEEAHITTLAVHPDCRNMQLAQVLMIKAIEDCYKDMIKYITLEVRENNIPAISLYQKFLFESVGMRKNYYQDNGENAIIMFTQNIWYDKFKNNFNLVKENINKVDVCYDE